MTASHHPLFSALFLHEGQILILYCLADDGKYSCGHKYNFFKEDQYQDLVEDDLAYFLKILKTLKADIHNPAKKLKIDKDSLLKTKVL